MEGLWKSFNVVGALFLVFAMGGCAQTHYSDGTNAGYCIGLSCPVMALMPAAALTVGDNPNRDFLLPNSLKLGKSTWADVAKSNSWPPLTKDGRLKIKDDTVIFITYVHAGTSVEPSELGVIPSHAVTYYFLHKPNPRPNDILNSDDILIGQQYSSSYKSDSTNFDETKVSSVIKGKSTKADVVKLLGMPSGSFTAPMVEALEYRYSTIRVGTSGDSKLNSFTKSLRIAFNDEGLASNIVYTPSDNK